MLKIKKYKMYTSFGKRSKDGISMSALWGYAKHPYSIVILTPIFTMLIHW